MSRTQEFITGELTKLGRQWGIWPTEVEVNARIFDDLVKEADEGQIGTINLGPERFVKLHVGERTVEVRRINPPEDEG